MVRKPVVDMGHCVNCDACMELCPDVFVRNEAGYIEVIDLPVYPEECIEEAVNCCPADCISWEESA
ncbi:MAG: ferredoxin [Syntrophobacteraceae bacterium]|nr:ferredoxin [Syntrophobacteraceae bacterium]